MINCGKDITSLYIDNIRLPETERAKLRGHRAANETRLENGLTKAKKPKPKKYIKQGSYAMHTMVQHPGNKYDIDDGVVFPSDLLIGLKGGAMSPLDVRQMVCNALQDNRFKDKPEVLKNCVRIYYEAGHHVDMPVYRELVSNGKVIYELASSIWRESDPEAITKWFNEQVVAKSPDTTEGRQLRRIVCLLKAFADSRKTWNMPCGFIISTLADEAYIAYKDRDDLALYMTMLGIQSRLILNLEVRNPIDTSEVISKGQDDAKIRELRDRLQWATGVLEPVTKTSCIRLEALKAWKTVFSTDYFDEDIEKLEEEQAKNRRVITGAVGSVNNAPKAWGGF